MPTSLLPDTPGYLVFGRFVGLWGVRGGIKIYSYTRPPSNIGLYSPWYACRIRDGDWQKLIPVEVTPKGHGLVAYLAGCTSREEAEGLIGIDVMIRREQLPALPAGEHYWAELIGLEAVTPEGERLGSVVDLIETGANDVLVVQGQKRHLVPFVSGIYVRRVDVAQGRIELDWGGDY